MSARKGPSDNNVNQGIVDFLMGKQSVCKYMSGTEL